MAETRETAMAVIHKAPEEVQGYIRMLEKKDVMALGTDEAFALRDAQGQIKAFKQKVHLSAQNGGLIQPVPSGPYVVSAQGYEIINEATGASVVYPRTVHVDGKDESNPHPIKDKNTGSTVAIACRAVAFKYSSKGIPMARDVTVIYDILKYRSADLLAKAKKFPQAFIALPAGMKPSDIDDLNIKGPQAWASSFISDEVTLWYNTRHPTCLEWLKQIVNREKKAMEFAQTFAARNAAKHLHGIQRPPGQVGNGPYDVRPVSEWSFTTLCWRPTGQNIIKWDAAQYEQLQDNTQRMLEGENVFGGLQIEQKTVTEEVEDEAYSDNTVYDPEDRSDQIDRDPDAEPDPEEVVEPDTEPDDEKAETVAGPKINPVQQLVSIRTDEDLSQFLLEACETKGVDPGEIEELSEKDAKFMLDLVYSLVAEAEGGG